MFEFGIVVDVLWILLRQATISSYGCLDLPACRPPMTVRSPRCGTRVEYDLASAEPRRRRQADLRPTRNAHTFYRRDYGRGSGRQEHVGRGAPAAHRHMAR